MALEITLDLGGTNLLTTSLPVLAPASLLAATPAPQTQRQHNNPSSCPPPPPLPPSSSSSASPSQPLSKPQSPPQPPPQPAKRHCWECLRRRLVCDGGQPFCRKCQGAGVVCPGYDDKKPLKWIANGTISSRPRKGKKKALVVVVAATPAGESSLGTTKAVPEAGGSGDGRRVPAVPARRRKQHQQQRGAVAVEASARTKDSISSSSSRSGSGEQDEQQSNTLAILPHIDMSSSTSDVVQAAYYYNTWVLPSYDPALALAPNPYISQFPLEILPYLTQGLRHTVVALSIGHRIHQLPATANRGDSIDLWSRLFHHRCLAIRELSRDVASEDKRASDSTIVTIILFLFVELQQMPATNWRQHLDGLTQLIELRGGPRKFLETLPSLKIGLASFYMVAVMANTTCPPLCDNSAFQHHELKDLLATMYGEGSYPTCLCPPALFMKLVDINYIRAQQALANVAAAGDSNRSITPLSLSSVPSLPSLRSEGSSSDVSLSTPQTQSRDEDLANVNAYEDPGNDTTALASVDFTLPICSPAAITTTKLQPHPRQPQEYNPIDPSLAQHDMTSQARTLLKEILAFSPEDAAAHFHTYTAERLVLGRLWQSALVIYLIASLRSLGALRSSPFLRGQIRGIRTAHGVRLYEQLKLAVESPGLKKSLLWPLVVCGFDAAAESGGATGSGGVAAAERRRFVEERLPLLGRDVGTSLPEYARSVLRKFWDSGRTDWDSCFDVGYAFVT